MSKKTSVDRTNLINKMVAEKIAEDRENQFDDILEADHDFTNLDNWFENYIDQGPIQEVQKKYTTNSKKRFPVKHFRIAVTLILVLGVSTIALSSNTEAFRFLNFNLFMDDQNEYTAISKVEDEELYSNKLLPAYLPENMKLTKYVDLESISIAVFESSTHELTLKISGINSTHMFDTENLEIIELDDLNGFYVVEDDYIRVYWSTDLYNFTIITNLEKNELIKIAKSIDY